MAFRLLSLQKNGKLKLWPTENVSQENSLSMLHNYRVKSELARSKTFRSLIEMYNKKVDLLENTQEKLNTANTQIADLQESHTKELERMRESADRLSFLERLNKNNLLNIFPK